MRLFITNNQDMDVSFDVVIMTPAEFNAISNHPYIVSSQFDSIVIDADEDINLEYLKATITKNIVVPRITGDITSKVVNLLATIYMDRAAELQYAFMMNADRLNEIVEELKEQFEWEKFY